MNRFTNWLDRIFEHKDVDHMWSDTQIEQQEPSERYVKAVVWCVLIFLGAIFCVAVYGIWRAA